MKKIIISGAGGFIGSSLTRKFVDEGYEVIAISRHFNPAFPDSSNIRRHNIDIGTPENLYELLPEGEYEAFYHLAWRGVNGPEKANPIIQLDNVRLTVACAEVANKIGCKKFLCAGTVAERTVESISNIEKTSGGMLYGVAKHTTHLMLETYCKHIGQDFVWMQFSNIYGPQNKTGNLVSYTLGELMKGNEASFGPALQPYDFIYVDDLIEAVYRLGINKTEKNYYVIGSGKPRILMEYLNQIGDEFGRPDLIKIGARPDDGVIYRFDMFDIDCLKQEIGDYITKDFTEGIRYTIDNY